jgi:hypothetical protein
MVVVIENEAAAFQKETKNVHIRDPVAKRAHLGMLLKSSAVLRVGGVKQYLGPSDIFSRESFAHHGTESILACRQALSGKRN